MKQCISTTVSNEFFRVCACEQLARIAIEFSLVVCVVDGHRRFSDIFTEVEFRQLKENTIAKHSWATKNQTGPTRMFLGVEWIEGTVFYYKFTHGKIQRVFIWPEYT